MIVDKVNDFKLENSVGGDEIAMRIDDEAYIHLMDVLTNLYSDKEMAVLREYTTNAWDAHIEARVSLPVEVTLPTLSDPLLKVKDYGIGLDAEGIREVYSQYGRSTKRSTNDQVGMLGLGCKSGLTYAAQFTVIGIKDGIKTTVSVSRRDDGSAVMTIADESETDEANGVEVMIPARTYNQFPEKARFLFQFWPKGSVLVNGEEPTPIDGLWITNKLLAVKDVRSDYVVMGNVPYPVSLKSELIHGYKLVAFVNIGDVVPTPSREALRDVKATTDTIASIEQDFRDNIGQAIQKTLNGCKSHPEALTVANQWRKALPAQFARSVALTYQGDAIPVEFKLKEAGAKFRLTELNSYKLSSASKHDQVDATYAQGALFVHSHSVAGTFTAAQKKKLIQYDEEKGLGVRNVILFHENPLPDAKWIDPRYIVDWATIAAIKLPRSGGAAWDPNRIPGSYDMWIDGKWSVGTPASEIDVDEPLFWVRHKTFSHKKVALLNERYPGCTVVSLYDNRVDKFRRLFPEARFAPTVLSQIYSGIAARIRPAQAMAYNLAQRGGYELRQTAKLDPARIDDPAIAKYLEIARREKYTQPKAITELLRFHNAGAYGSENPLEAQYTSPFEEYRLFDRYELGSDNGREHTYIYLNAAYAALFKEDK